MAVKMVVVVAVAVRITQEETQAFSQNVKEAPSSHRVVVVIFYIIVRRRSISQHLTSLRPADDRPTLIEL